MIYLLFTIISLVNAFTAAIIVYFSYIQLNEAFHIAELPSVEFIFIFTLIHFACSFLYKLTNRKDQIPSMQMDIIGRKTIIKKNTFFYNPFASDFLISGCAFFLFVISQLIRYKLLYMMVDLTLVINISVLFICNLLIILIFYFVNLHHLTRAKLGRLEADFGFNIGVGFLSLSLAAALLASILVNLSHL